MSLRQVCKPHCRSCRPLSLPAGIPLLIDIRDGNERASAVITRLEELLAVQHDRPLHLAELCAAAGVPERTLRLWFQKHLGMAPVRYMWLRRMHLARSALMRASPATATVTGIAIDHGFWELGRFSVAYRTLFGESPSASLRRRIDEAGFSRSSSDAVAESA
jgi:transcriptional regulator GlxA family with amidase domain